MRFVAIKKWKDGGETTMEYLETCEDALAWIQKQDQPNGDEYKWYVGEY